ncbi:unnamed protein product, partial [Amoebophrya sp. A25]|eukprot:GSA25T00002948001.1
MPSVIKLSKATLSWEDRAPTVLKLESQIRESEMRYDELRRKFSEAERRFACTLEEAARDSDARKSLLEEEKDRAIERLETELDEKRDLLDR